MLYRRNNSRHWWIRIRHPGGKEIRRSTGTEDKTAAEEYETRLKQELWRQVRLGEKPRFTWKEAAVRWIEDNPGKATLEDDISMLRWLDAPLSGLYLDQIDRSKLDAIQRLKRAEGASPARVNRIIGLVRAILRRAWKEWEWIERVPAVRMLPEPDKRIRWITREQADYLLAELDRTAPHVADMARFSLATGLREANITLLEWSQVDLERRIAWIHPDQAKARRAIGVPLNTDAVLVLRRQLGRHPTRVFCYRSWPSEPWRPIRKAGGQAWRRALKRVGIEDFRWHDLRHTWASWHVQSGTPLAVLQELGGWASLTMVLRYAHLAPEHLAEHAARIETGVRLVVQNAHTQKTGSGKS